MATEDDAQRKRPSFVKNATAGTTGAMRVRAGGVGKGGSAASASTKPVAFAFNRKKPASTTSKAPTTSAGIKFPGATMSGPGGGALRVPVFGKKAASVTAPTTTKAPFAVAMGANGVAAEARAATALKPQPSSGILRFGSFSVPKTGGEKSEKKVAVPETMPEQKPNAAPAKKAVIPRTTLKANVNGGRTGPPAFGRVKVPPPKQSSRFQVRQNGVTMNASKSSPLRFKSTRNVLSAVSSKTTTNATNGSRFELKLSHNVQKSSPSIASNPLRVPAATPAPTAHAFDAGTASKKRIQPQPAQNMSTPVKKLRLENNGSAVPKTLQELNVVSPEPHGPGRAPNPRADMSDVPTNDIAQGDAINVPDRQTALDISVHTDPNSSEHRGVLASLTHGVYVTAEEEQLANFTVDSDMLEVESEGFLKRIRNLQLFMDDVGEQNLLSCNELLDTNAISSECLLDMMTDVTAIKGGVMLMELDELSSKVQQDLDSQGPSSTGITFPW